MAELENVVVGIEHCDRLGCSMCPYKPGGYSPMDCRIQLMRDALELLKEQKAKTGHWVSVNDGDIVAIDNDGFPERTCFCSECKKYLIASDEYAVYGRYCPFCGAKMEGR